MKRNTNGQFVKNDVTWRMLDNVAYCYSNGELRFFTDIENVRLFDGRPIAKMANGYSGTRDNGKIVLVHRLIINAPDGSVIDHINRNKKDNRISNLRITDKSVNAFNSGLRRDNKSGATGVMLRKDTNRWSAAIKKDGKKHCLGCYGTKDEAVKARKEAEVLYFGFEQ